MELDVAVKVAGEAVVFLWSHLFFVSSSSEAAPVPAMDPSPSLPSAPTTTMRSQRKVEKELAHAARGHREDGCEALVPSARRQRGEGGGGRAAE